MGGDPRRAAAAPSQRQRRNTPERFFTTTRRAGQNLYQLSTRRPAHSHTQIFAKFKRAIDPRRGWRHFAPPKKNGEKKRTGGGGVSERFRLLQATPGGENQNQPKNERKSPLKMCEKTRHKKDPERERENLTKPYFFGIYGRPKKCKKVHIKKEQAPQPARGAPAHKAETL